MRAYMLNTYGEHGPETIFFAVTPEELIEKARWKEEFPLEDEEKNAFWRLVSEPNTKANKAHDLVCGWGGWQLTILDSEAEIVSYNTAT
jgi:hypothetical protein